MADTTASRTTWRGEVASPALVGVLDGQSSPADAERETLRWIEAMVPGQWQAAVLAGDVAELYRLRPPEVYRQWYPTLAGSGLVVPDWDPRYGGLGVTAAAARAIGGCLNRFRLNRMGALGLYLAAPTVLEWGTDEQRLRFLPPIAWDTERWCQLFSEPGSGSDLASLATSARRTDDGEWRISGQKVWSSFAHEADFGILLARTDPAQRKRAGITMFACPLDAPGVEVRPLRQITGEAEFNEVFLDDVVLSDLYRLGPVNAGFKVAATTLAGERGMISGAGAGGVKRAGGRSLEQLMVVARTPGPEGEPPPWSEPLVRQRLTRLWSRQQTLRWTNQRAKVAQAHGTAGPRSSIGKLLHSELNQDIQEAWFDLLGDRAVGAPAEDAEAEASRRGLLRSRANTIEGGTSEIQRTILGERVLGLPREPDPYHDRPWSEIPRS